MNRLTTIILVIAAVPILLFAQSPNNKSKYNALHISKNNFHNLQLQDTTQSYTRTPLHFDAIAVEIAGGIFAGLVIGEAGQIIKYLGLLPGHVNKQKRDDKSLKDDLKFYYPLYTGLIVGSALFVDYVGDRRGERGALWAAFTGSAISFLISFRINETLKFTAPSIGATIAYNLTRNPVSKTSSNSSFVNIKDGDFNVSIPQISLKYDYSYGGSGLIQSVNLMRISF